MQPNLGVRLSLFYASLFSIIGVQMPFWPLYLSSKGLDAAEIGQILAAAYGVKVCTNPLIGHVVDRRGERRRPLLVLAVTGTIATALFAPAQGFAMIALVTLFSAAAISSMMPLGDSLTMMSAASHRLDYGRIRLWGSLSFILTANLAGWTLVDAPRPWILWSCVAFQALTIAAVWHLPDIRAARPASAKPPPLSGLFKGGTFALFLAVCSLTQVSHMIYYGFATLHWQAAGLSGGVIGGLWAEGVAAEVILFACGAVLVKRFGPALLICSAGLGGVLRWTVLGLTTDPVWLASVQFLHAFTFAANHLGAMHFINRFAPSGLSARAQAIYASVANGIVPGLAMLAAGRLYGGYGGQAFFVMTVFSLLGTLLAVPLLRRSPKPVS